ncbi:MAG TPA: hypothetical protein VGP63_04065 [Planctomycetaceae bacterium]|jgi:hypothetical protein|nr:hypothetical protein [Planctomycetaceae bacterium]
MTDNTPEEQFDQRLGFALGSAGEPDFDAWQERHAEAIAYLNPVVTDLRRRRRKILVRTTKLILASTACACVAWFWIPERETFAFAQAIKKIDNAKGITWTITLYDRCTSKDGKRSWLAATRTEGAYRQPGLYRITQLDDDGMPRWVHIANCLTGQTLDFDLKEKKVTKPITYYELRDPLGKGPFAGVAKLLETAPLEFVGQRKVKGKTVNVFRSRHPSTHRTGDYWIDAQSKELVGCADPGADRFDPQTDPDRDHPAEKEFSKMQILGGIRADIDFDAQLDANLFSLTPPAGYEVTKEPPPAPIGEAGMAEWLGAVARVNNGIFPVALTLRLPFEPDHFSEILAKKSDDRSPAERAMYDLHLKYSDLVDFGTPLRRFMKENTVDGTFRYVGVGVKLGAVDRIVCWYKSKSADKYRAILGDLTIKDVSPKELPLPVDR